MVVVMTAIVVILMVMVLVILMHQLSTFTQARVGCEEADCGCFSGGGGGCYSDGVTGQNGALRSRWWW